MGSFLAKLFGGGPVELAMGRGWTIHVMVEAAAWQDALRELKGWRENDYKVVATLVPEPGNRIDGKSVRVEIGGRMVGYLPRMLAGSYTLDTSGECIAKITEGFELQDGTRALGVCLNLAWPPRPGL